MSTTGPTGAPAGPEAPTAPDAPTLFAVDPAAPAEPSPAAEPAAAPSPVPVAPDPGPVAPAPEPFSVVEPLAPGITVLEASAGTGKTHTVASIVVAEVAAGRPLDQILVVTFTRKATGTLRERVWQRLGEAARALAAPVAGGDGGGGDEAGHGGDELVAHLRRGTPAEVERRRARLEQAVSEFDTATIATTHGFCQQVLASLGVVGDAERGIEVTDDLGDLVDDAVDDLFVRRFHAASGGKLFSRGEAYELARVVIQNPDAEIAGVDGNDTDLLRYRFARTLRDRIAEQKRRGRLVTYDDLLTRLQASVDDPQVGSLVIARLQRRFTMAIVDEFQDTDTIQWRILQAAFGAPPSRLVLVGDPKQAIYAFRGGDVHTYLAATLTDGAVLRSLDVSWRSDQGLLDAVDGLLDGAQLGDPRIAHRPLRARPGAQHARLLDPAGGAPLTVRVVDRQHPGLQTTPQGWLAKDSARSFIASDLAAEVVRTLTGGVELVERDAAGVAGPRRPVTPGDIAVLVRANRYAEDVRDHLRSVGVPAVAHTTDDVIASTAAGEWLTLLRALEQPASSLRLRAVAIGAFFGWDAPMLASAADAEWERLDDRVHDWIGVVRSHGAAGLLARLDTTEHLSARLLSTGGGERMLADLRHVAELLDHHHPGRPTSLAALVTWLTDERTRVRTERRRRLESDADAVAIHTIHSAKGLEFPIVLLPTLWDAPYVRKDELPVFHDPARDGARSIGVGMSGRVRADQVALAREERDAEDLRLLYVALTRARHRVVLWWATASDSASSPLARVLLGRDGETGAVATRLGRRPDEAAIRDAFAALPAAGAGLIDVVDAEGPADGSAPPFRVPVDDHGPLAVRPFARTFDQRWTRTSYSGLTAAAHDAASEQARHDDATGAVLGADPATGDTPGGAPGVGIDTDDDVTVDEPALAPAPAGADALDPDDPLAAPVPLGELVAGPRVGTMVHDLLEHVDFAAADLVGEVAAAAVDAGAERHVDDQLDQLVAGLVAAIETPLGPIAGGRRLRDLDRRDRLDELSFDLPLAGGDDPTGYLTMGAIADVFATLSTDDPLAGYHERLRDPLLDTEVRGFLTGSIDLVARLGERHVVVDYKTNRLAPLGDELRLWHFRPAALTEAMIEAHYPLQAALYAVALHRFLRWRLPDYDPDRHLGGVAYLFLRGMTGPSVPLVDGQPCGVFAWTPPATFVRDLSDALDRGDG